MSEAVLSVENLSAETLDGRPLLDDISFSIERGRTLALVGESGSGKTLSALSVVRLLPEAIRLRAGGVHFRGRDLLALPAYRMGGVRGRGIGFVFQEPMTAMNPVKTVGDQVLEGVRLNGDLRGAAARRRVRELLEQVGLDAERVFGAGPHELSGGMRQRAVIAMALSGGPELLIADEPTTALDVTTEAQVLRLIKSLQRELGMTMLFISHDLSVVSNVADEVVVMREGRVVDRGDVRGFFKRQRHAYTMELRRAIPGLATCDKRLFDGGDVAEDMPARASADADDGAPLLSVKDLRVEFPVRGGLFRRVIDRVRAVDGASFELRKGRTLALVGESGSGKTSVAKALLRLVGVADGEIQFAGMDVPSLKGDDLKAYRRHVQAVFQDPFSSLNPKRTIGRALTEGMRVHGVAEDDEAMRELAVKLLADVGMEADALSRYPHEFSGGQRQRICIARALSLSPQLMVCDEPTSALDVLVQAQILDLFKGMQRRLGLSYLFISHDLSAVAHIADDVAVMHEGRIVEYGGVERVLREPRDEYTQSLLAAVPQLRED